jgi:hypothetical protein
MAAVATQCHAIQATPRAEQRVRDRRSSNQLDLKSALPAEIKFKFNKIIRKIFHSQKLVFEGGG